MLESSEPASNTSNTEPTVYRTLRRDYQNLSSSSIEYPQYLIHRIFSHQFHNPSYLFTTDLRKTALATHTITSRTGHLTISNGPATEPSRRRTRTSPRTITNGYSTKIS